jgi:exodeoxyribonuclease-3
VVGLFCWWYYRAGNFHKRMVMPIDLLMHPPPLADATSSAHIDPPARTGQTPSDHAPVFVDVDVALRVAAGGHG